MGWPSTPGQVGSCWNQTWIWCPCFQLTCSKLWDCSNFLKLVEEGKQEQGKQGGIGSEGFKKEREGVCCDRNSKQLGPIAESCENHEHSPTKVLRGREQLNQERLLFVREILQTRRIKWKYPAFLNRRKCFFFTPRTVKLSNLLPEVTVQGQKGDAFQQLVCIRLNLCETTNCKDKMQSLAEKAPNLRIAGGACKREFVSYVLALSISYWLLLEMWCWPRQTLGLARPSVFLCLFRLLVLRCCTLH